MTDYIGKPQTRIEIEYNSPNGTDRGLAMTTDDAPEDVMKYAGDLVPAGSVITHVELDNPAEAP